MIDIVNKYKDYKIDRDYPAELVENDYYIVKLDKLSTQSFIYNKGPENYKELHVNHKDRNTTNNHESNLEWCTPQENSNHRFTRDSLFNEFKIKQYTNENKATFIQEFESVQKVKEIGTTAHFFGNFKRGIKTYMNKYSNDKTTQQHLICDSKWSFVDPEGALEAYFVYIKKNP